MAAIRSKIKIPRMIAWSSVHERLPMYVFPAFLILTEWIFRSISSVDTETFIGPTLAAVGAGYVVPLTIMKKRNYPQDVVDIMNKYGLTAQPIREIRFIALCWVFLFFFTGLWLLSLFLSARHFGQNSIVVPEYDYPGIINYLGGFLLSEVREVI